jgi:glycolate oxidase
MLRPDFIRHLEEIVGTDNILTSEEDTAAYDHITAEGGVFRPDALLYPVTGDQTADILRTAHQAGIHVLPAGSGTRRFLKQGLQDGIVLSTVKMNRIREVDREDMIAVVEPGVPLTRLKGALEEEGLFFPPYPHAFEDSTLAGCAAIGAGGAASPKYGVFKQHLLGMEFFLPTGEVMGLGGRTLKNVVGYDLTSFFCGSEGTLGVIGPMTLRLFPAPPAQRLLLGGFNSMSRACMAVQSLVLYGPVPARVTVLDSWLVNGPIKDKITTMIGPERSVYHWPAAQDFEATVVCLNEGIDEAVVRDSRRMMDALQAGGAEEIQVVDDLSEIRNCWSAQGQGLASIPSAAPGLLTGDFTIPLESTPMVIDHCLDLAKKYQLELTWAGYHGKGIIHPVLLLPGAETDQDPYEEKVFGEMAMIAQSAGGKVSGPFPSVGIERAKFDQPVDGVNRELVAGIKGLLDPKGIMKPV